MVTKHSNMDLYMIIIALEPFKICSSALIFLILVNLLDILNSQNFLGRCHYIKFHLDKGYVLLTSYKLKIYSRRESPSLS